MSECYDEQLFEPELLREQAWLVYLGARPLAGVGNATMRNTTSMDDLIIKINKDVWELPSGQNAVGGHVRICSVDSLHQLVEFLRQHPSHHVGQNPLRLWIHPAVYEICQFLAFRCQTISPNEWILHPNRSQSFTAQAFNLRIHPFVKRPVVIRLEGEMGMAIRKAQGMRTRGEILDQEEQLLDLDRCKLSLIGWLHAGKNEFASVDHGHSVLGQELAQLFSARVYKQA